MMSSVRDRRGDVEALKDVERSDGRDIAESIQRLDDESVCGDMRGLIADAATV